MPPRPRKPTPIMQQRREKLRSLLLGSGPAMSMTALAQSLGVSRQTLYEDIRALRAEVPQEEAEALPSHVFLMFDRAEHALLLGLQEAEKAKSLKHLGPLADRLASLAEKRVRVAGLLNVVSLREQPTGFSNGLALGARVNPGTGVMEFMLQSIPGMTEEQQVALIKNATRLAGQEALGVER